MGNRASGTLALSGAGDINAASITFGPAVAGVAGTYILDLSAATGPGARPWRNFAGITTNQTGFAQAHQIKLGANAGSPVDIRIGSGTFGSTASAGSITGFGSLVKVGTGTLALVGTTANTFTGNVEVYGGTLSTTADNLVGDAANGIVLQGGSFATATNVFTTNRGITLAPAPLPIGTAIANQISAGIATTLNGVISNNFAGVPGAIEYLGTGAKNINGVNTYTGSTGINAGVVTFTADSAFGSGGAIILRGGTLSLGAAAAAPVTMNRNIFITGATALDNSNATAGNNLTLSRPILGGVNTVTFSTKAATNITFSAASPNFYGTLNSSAGGNMVFSGAGSMTEATITLGSTGTNTLDMSGLNRRFANISTVGIGASVQLGANGVLSYGFLQTSVSAISGNILGGANAQVIRGYSGGNATTAWTSSGSTFSGGLHILATGGTGNFTVSGTGVIPLQAGVTIGGWADQGTFFRLDNTGTGNNARITDTQAIHINNSSFEFSTNTTTASNEVVGSLRGAGYSIVTLTTGGTLNFADAGAGLTRVNNGTFLFRAGATTFGTAAATTIPNLLFGNGIAGQLLGGGGPGATPKTSILPYAVGAGTVGGTGNTFVTYGANGIRPLDTVTEYNATLLGVAADDNVRVSNATLTTLTIPVAQTVNSLIITSGAVNTTRIDGGILTVDSGAINTPISTVCIGTNTYTALQLGIQTAELRTGLTNTRELIVHNTNGDLNIAALFSTAGGLTKSGPNALYLTRAAGNAYTGGTTVNGGAQIIDNLNAINDSATQPLTLSGGNLFYRGPSATLAATSVTFGGGSATAFDAGLNVTAGTTLTVPTNIGGFGGLNKLGTGTLVLTGTNTFSTVVSLAGGTLAISSSAALGTVSTVLFGSDTGTQMR